MTLTLGIGTLSEWRWHVNHIMWRNILAPWSNTEVCYRLKPIKWEIVKMYVGHTESPNNNMSHGCTRPVFIITISDSDQVCSRWNFVSGMWKRQVTMQQCLDTHLFWLWSMFIICGCDWRNGAYGLCDQCRSRPACASAQSWSGSACCRLVSEASIMSLANSIYHDEATWVC